MAILLSDKINIKAKNVFLGSNLPGKYKKYKFIHI